MDPEVKKMESLDEWKEKEREKLDSLNEEQETEEVKLTEGE